MSLWIHSKFHPGNRCYDIVRDFGFHVLEMSDSSCVTSEVPPPHSPAAPAVHSSTSPPPPPPPPVSQASLELLVRLFPAKKRSVLELVLRRCGHDLLQAIELCAPLPSSSASSGNSRTYLKRFPETYNV